MAKQSRKSEKHALTVSAADLTLRDVRVLKIQCERFNAPEQAPRGKYNVSSTVRIHLTPPASDADPRGLRVIFSMAFVGLPLAAGEQHGDKANPSFRVDLQSEGLFTFKSGLVVKEDDISDDVVGVLVAQLHPVMMNQARGLVADMGFRGVRPRLGFDLASLGEVDRTTESDESAPAERVVKAKAKA